MQTCIWSLQEAARAALRQRQLREQECARINAIKIHNQWRKIMRLAKADELRQQIEILSQNHEREVDRKDALIQVWCLFCFIWQRRKGQQMHSGLVDDTFPPAVQQLGGRLS
jgi:hypothetical protein